MVVFAVSMIVAVTLIHFSRTAIMDAKNNLAGFQNKDTLKENFVEIDTATAKQIVFLAEECYDRYESTLDRKICFSVKINNPFVGLSSQLLRVRGVTHSINQNRFESVLDVEEDEKIL